MKKGFLFTFLFIGLLFAACVNEVQVEEPEVQDTGVSEDIFYPEGLYKEDGESIYWNGKIVENADVETFQGILDPNDTTPENINDNDFYFFKDKNALYVSSGPFGGNAVLGRYVMEHTENLVLPTGKLLYFNYVTDGESVYYLSADERLAVKIPEADVDTFKEIDGDYGYIRDKNHIYFRGEILEGADIKTFTRAARSSVYTDKDHVYYFGENIKDADSKTFQTIRNRNGGICYYKDKDYVYRIVQPFPEVPTMVIVEGADPETFECIDGSYEFDGKDENYFYQDGVINPIVPESEMDEIILEVR